MSAKLYREIIRFLKNQRAVLETFEKENDDLLCVRINKLLESLRYNCNLLEENTNNYLDKVDKENK